MTIIKNLGRIVLIICVFLPMIACAPKTRMGMIKDPKTGISYGSVIEKSFFIDASQFENNKIKISARNVSGDLGYNIQNFINDLKASFSQKGFPAGEGKDFGVKFDVAIEYSGHTQQNMAAEYGFLGGAAGGITGYRSDAKAGTAIGILSGATLGAIIGSYAIEDTYIVIANVRIGVIDRVKDSKRSVVFSSSPELQDDSRTMGVAYFTDVKSSKIAVFAGGRKVEHSQIVSEVKKRLLSILSDII